MQVMLFRYVGTVTGLRKQLRRLAQIEKGQSAATEKAHKKNTLSLL